MSTEIANNEQPQWNLEDFNTYSNETVADEQRQAIEDDDSGPGMWLRPDPETRTVMRVLPGYPGKSSMKGAKLHKFNHPPCRDGPLSRL